MELVLFALFFLLSLVFLGYGIFKPIHSEFLVIGFLTIFLLSFFMINNNIQIPTGTNTTTTYAYGGANNSLLETNALEQTTYKDVTNTGILNKTIGYWLAIISIFGIMASMFEARRTM